MSLRKSVSAIRNVVARGMSNTAGASSVAISTANLHPYKLHRSNAEELIAQVPVVEISKTVAMCDGGGGGKKSTLRFSLSSRALPKQY